MRPLAWLALAIGLIPVLAGCGGGATPTPETTPTPEAMAGKARLVALSPIVEFHEREMDEGTEVAVDETIGIEPGANVLTKQGGRAKLVWDGFLTHELLTDTDTLLSFSQPGRRHAILDQATGTGRYVLEGPGEPATLTVKAGWVNIQVKQGTADFVVSLVPGTEPSAWLVMLEGTADVDRDGELVNLTTGQAAGFTESGPLPEAMDIDTALVKAWYEDVAKGTATTSIAGVAFRCVVSADSADFLSRAQADAPAAGEPLAKGTVVEAIQRDDTGQWLRVKPLGKPIDGWVGAEDLVCGGPISSVSTTAPGETGPPTPTAPLPTRAFLPVRGTPTLLAAPTPTPTPTIGAAAEISFSAGDDEIFEGECTTLRWTVKNVRAYYVDGEGKAGDTGSMKVCPDETTTYELRAVKRDGSEETKSVTVKVRQREEPTSPPVPTETSAPPPAPAETPVAPPQPSETPGSPPFATDTPTP